MMEQQAVKSLKQPDFIRQLNGYQKEAVFDESRALLVNAHVGSGKTTVLIAKVLYLSLEKDVDFRDMVVLTFTNKAADEMKERIKKHFPELNDNDIPYVGTFHSVAKTLLSTVLAVEDLGFTKEFTIMDPDEMMEMANRLIIEKRYRIKYQNKLLTRIEEYKKGKKLYSNMKYEDDIERLWDDIEALKRAQNKMDFDDLIEHATLLLKDGTFQPKWIIVDEFQDCDEAQLEFIKAMCGADTKLFVVGDPNQIIYTWRGSDREVFAKFKAHFDAKEMTLPINYRSTATILDAAKTFLSDSSKLEGMRDQGSKIKVKHHYNPFQEAHYLADEIKNLVRSGLAYNDIAVLYRTKRQAAVLEDVLEREGIPFEVSVKKSLKDVPVLSWFLSVLKAAVNEKDENNMIAALMHREFGDDVTYSEVKRLLKGESGVVSTLFDRIKDFRHWARRKTPDDIGELYDYFALDDHLSPTSASYEAHKGFILDFLNKAKEFMEEKKLGLYEGLLDFVNSSTLYGLSVFDETADLEDDSVKLMTLHACKGLEFKKVFIIGANDGLLPLRTKNLDEYEEEKRLFFVGMTRAKDDLEISYYTNPSEPWVTGGPSTFLSMIPEHLIEREEVETAGEVDLKDLARKIVERMEQKEVQQLDAEEPVRVEAEPVADDGDDAGAEASDGQLVRHPKYGEGVIEKEDEATITVKFEGYGSKTFSKLFVRLEYL